MNSIKEYNHKNLIRRLKWWWFCYSNRKKVKGIVNAFDILEAKQEQQNKRCDKNESRNNNG